MPKPIKTLVREKITKKHSWCLLEKQYTQNSCNKGNTQTKETILEKIMHKNSIIINIYLFRNINFAIEILQKYFPTFVIFLK